MLQSAIYVPLLLQARCHRFLGEMAEQIFAPYKLEIYTCIRYFILCLYTSNTLHFL